MRIIILPVQNRRNMLSKSFKEIMTQLSQLNQGLIRSIDYIGGFVN